MTFVPEIILIEESFLKRLWEEQTYFTVINQELLRRAIKNPPPAQSSINNNECFCFDLFASSADTVCAQSGEGR